MDSSKPEKQDGEKYNSKIHEPILTDSHKSHKIPFGELYSFQIFFICVDHVDIHNNAEEYYYKFTLNIIYIISPTISFVPYTSNHKYKKHFVSF